MEQEEMHLEQEHLMHTRIDMTNISDKLEALQNAMSEVIVGKHDIIDLILVAILADGHILLEGMPGVAKTLIAKTTAQLINVGYNRIQFTPDLMPSDVLGTNIFNSANTKFEFHPGPIFSNIVLIDEINRSPAKTQAALFEVMEERQITMDGVKYKLDPPFIILATQNPVEQEGTYRLPEAQLDRFLFKITMDYPTFEDEINILKLHHQQNNSMANHAKTWTPILTKEEIAALRETIKQVHISDELMTYIAQLITQTRDHADIYLGASPRASLALLNASKAYAALQGRDFVIPEDIIYLSPLVLRHRIIIMPEKEMEGFISDDIIHELIKAVPVPR